MKKIAIVLITMLVLTACGSNKEVNLELYGPIIDKYTAVTNGEEAANDINWLANLYSSDYMENMYAALVDFDDNGTKELVIAQKFMGGGYAIFDIYTIVGDSVYRLTNEENGLEMIGERQIIMMLDDGTFLYTGSDGSGGRFFEHYAFNDDKTDLVKINEGSSEEAMGITAEIINPESLPWTVFGQEKDLGHADYMRYGDYSLLEGTWRNAKGSEIVIKGKELLYTDDNNVAEIENAQDGYNGTINLSISFDELFGAAMVYIPEDYEGDLSFIDGKTIEGKDKFIITQSMATADEVYYRFNE